MITSFNIFEANKYLKWEIGSKVWAIGDCKAKETPPIKFGEQYTIKRTYHFSSAVGKKVEFEELSGLWNVDLFTQDPEVYKRFHRGRIQKRFDL